MSDNILTKDRNGADISIAAKDVASVLFPRNIITDAAGADMTPAKETTAQLLLTAAQAIQAAAEALDAKTAVVNTGAVALDAGTLAALETVSVANFPATQPVSAAALPLPAGASTEATLANLDADVGAQNDAAATTDTGTFSIIAFIKRAMQNWTTLLGRVPAQGQAAMAASLPVAIASNQSALSVNPAAALLTSYSQAGVIAINTVLLTLDCSQYRNISLQCVSMGTTGVVTPQWSNDNATWVAATMFTVPGASATTFNAAGLWTIPVAARYLRLRLSTATTAGTTTLSIHQFDDGVQPFLATQPVSGTVTATVTGGTTLPVTPTQTFTNSAASTNDTSTKASAGTVWSVVATNINAAVRYLKLYNKASAPTVGTDVPVLTIPIPAGGIVQVDGGSNGIRFGTGIAWALTTGGTDADATGVAAAEIKVAIAYT